MKKSGKMMLCLFITGMLTVSALAGCGGADRPADNGAADAAAKTTSAAAPAEKEKVTLKLVHQIPPEVNLQDNPILKKAEELTGIKLDIEAPPVNNYFDRCRIIMASGDLPDFFLNGTDTDFENWSKQGLLAVLDDRLSKDKYPDLMTNVTPERWGDTTASSTGKIQGVPKPNNVDMWGYIINNEWLKKLNLQAPANLDEFLNVCRAFTNDDPDGNNQKDTYGYTTQDDIWFLHTDFLKTNWNLSVHNGVPDFDGAYKARENMSGTVDYLTFLRDMYREGILDPEFFTNKGSVDQEKFLQGKVGIIGASQKDAIKFITQNKVPLDKYSFHAPLAAKAGEKGKFIVPPSNWCAFLIPSSSQKIDDVLRFLDFANSEEGFKLFLIGIEGTHYGKYDINKREIERTPEQIELLNTHTSNMLAFANGYRDRAVIEGGDTPEQTKKFQDEWTAADKATEKVYTPFVKMYDAFFSTVPDLKEKTKEMEIKYITNNISREQLAEYIAGEYKPKTEKFDSDYSNYMQSIKK